jgi:hypothetical protein
VIQPTGVLYVGIVSFASISTQSTAKAPAGFKDWLLPVPIHALMGRKHGQWYALATDFQVVGVGLTEQAARNDLSGLLETYLRSIYDEGRPFDDAVRPVGALTKLRLFFSLKPRKRQLLVPFSTFQILCRQMGVSRKRLVELLSDRPESPS